MMRICRIVFVLALTLALTASMALAQGKGQGKGPGTAPGRSGAPQSPGSSAEHGPKVEPASHHPSSVDTKKKSPGELLAQNEKLSSRLAAKLPGTDLQQAAGGFKNLGDFVSAVHVSHNLGIPFADLRTRMGSGQSLGEAIHVIKPGVDSAAEVRRAQKQAEKDLKETGASR